MDKDLVALKDRLLTYHMGEEKSITTKELVALGYCTARDLRFKVRDLRLAGYAVCSGSNGYYIAKDYSEVQSTIRLLESHISAIQETIDSLKSP